MSVPIAWAELRTSLEPGTFTAQSVPARFARRTDPWAGYWTCRQKLTATMLRALETSG